MVNFVNPSEYFHSSKAIIILFTFNVCIQLIISLLKFTKFRNEEFPPILKNVERIMDLAFAFLIISILNIVTFSTYIYAAIATYFYLFFFIFFEVIEHKLSGNKDLIKLGVPGLFLFTLFMNFWINNEDNI